MRKYLEFHAQFLLPEGFNGSMTEALELLTAYAKEKLSASSRQKTVEIPPLASDSEAFKAVVQQEGMLYATYRIEPYDPQEEEDDLMDSQYFVTEEESV